MVCRSTGHNINLADIPDRFFIHSHTGKVNLSIFYNRIDGIGNRFRLLVDFFHHKVLISSLFSSFCIPINLLWFFFNFFAIQIVKGDLSPFHMSHLQISNIINISCIFQNRRNIGSNIRLPVSHTQNHRAVFSCYKNLSRIITEHHGECIGTSDAYHRMADCLNR